MSNPLVISTPKNLDGSDNQKYFKLKSEKMSKEENKIHELAIEYVQNHHNVAYNELSIEDRLDFDTWVGKLLFFATWLENQKPAKPEIPLSAEAKANEFYDVAYRNGLSGYGLNSSVHINTRKSEVDKFLAGYNANDSALSVVGELEKLQKYDITISQDYRGNDQLEEYKDKFGKYILVSDLWEINTNHKQL